MTDEAGAITGELELLTRVTPDDGGIEAMVRYAGAQDLYTVSVSPVRATSERRPGRLEHRAAHERILETLPTPGRVEVIRTRRPLREVADKDQRNRPRCNRPTY
jgi:hypothetical protein